MPKIFSSLENKDEEQKKPIKQIPHFIDASSMPDNPPSFNIRNFF